MKNKKPESSWSVKYNQDNDNNPCRIDLYDVNGKLQTIDINELVLNKLNPIFERLLEDNNKYILAKDYSFAYNNLVFQIAFELKKLDLQFEKAQEDYKKNYAFAENQAVKEKEGVK